MQLGTRWSVGAEPPARVPEALRARIAVVEAERGAAASDLSWTLTWLEGRAIVELGDGTVVREGETAGSDSDDEW